jgi:hypothetical protein
MKVTSVTYRSNRPTVGSKYIHQHVELTAKVGPRETAAGVLEKLRGEVHALLYPELAGLRQKIAKVAPTVYARLANYADVAIAELYSEHTEAFADLLKGDMAPSIFIQEVLS